MLTNEQLLNKISDVCAVLAHRDGHGILDVEVAQEALPGLVQRLRDDADLRFEMLMDLVSIDYAEFPEQKKGRFGVVYNFKSLSLGHRLLVRVILDEKRPVVGSIHTLYKNADWLEREAWDQMGIVFDGHPNLRRILNHFQFVGHPLRKDYPITRQQWLTESDDLMEEMDKRLAEKGYPK